MDAMTILILAIIGILFASKAGVSLGSIGLGTITSSPNVTPSVVPPPTIATNSTAQQTIQTEQTGVMAANTALNAIPVVGPALAAAANAISSALFSASKQR